MRLVVQALALGAVLSILIAWGFENLGSPFGDFTEGIVRQGSGWADFAVFRVTGRMEVSATWSDAEFALEDAPPVGQPPVGALMPIDDRDATRSEERRVGTEC